MVPWAEPQVSHPCGSAGQRFPMLIRSNRKKKKKKKERDKQLILEVVLVTLACLRFYSKNQAFTDETKCIPVS